jgi:hypothetical protein
VDPTPASLGSVPLVVCRYGRLAAGFQGEAYAILEIGEFAAIFRYDQMTRALVAVEKATALQAGFFKCRRLSGGSNIRLSGISVPVNTEIERQQEGVPYADG